MISTFTNEGFISHWNHHPYHFHLHCYHSCCHHVIEYGDSYCHHTAKATERDNPRIGNKLQYHVRTLNLLSIHRLDLLSLWLEIDGQSSIICIYEFQFVFFVIIFHNQLLNFKVWR